MAVQSSTPSAPSPTPSSGAPVGILAAIGGFFKKIWRGLIHLLGPAPASAADLPPAAGGKPAQDPQKSPAPAPKSRPSPLPAAKPATYTVVPGDTLSGIAAKVLGNANRWTEIYSLNRDKISDPNLIYPGQVLTLPSGASTPAAANPGPPPTAGSATYTVAPGDTLSGIAARTLGDASRWYEIFRLNQSIISNPNQIYPGQVLRLPGGNPGTSSAPGPAPALPPGNPGEPWSPGPGQLQGADTSNWQSLAQFDASIQGTQWSAIKASEGTGYTDPSFQSRWNLLGQKIASGSMKLRMAYVYLDVGSGAAQAQHFLDVVGIHGKLPAGTRLALDWEGPALNSPGTLRDAANYIHQVTGTWPVIYVQGSEMAVAKNMVPNAPIWEASWGSGSHPDVPFLQYSDGPGYDHDVFNGNIAALTKFAGVA